jgi:formylglycine-generating enzyme required for sulfatase activity
MAGGSIYKIGLVTPTEVASANGYRLPSEKEWEFAARGGTQTNGYTYSGSNNLDEVGWHHENSGGAIYEVGKKLANELGIYDMSGNVLEWCWDATGGSRMIRGGDHHGDAVFCTVDYRTSYDPECREEVIGFRVALSSV